MHDRFLDKSPDELPIEEVTFKVPHPYTGGKCSLEGKEIEITFNVNSKASLNMDGRTHCPECDVALI